MKTSGGLFRAITYNIKKGYHNSTKKAEEQMTVRRQVLFCLILTVLIFVPVRSQAGGPSADDTKQNAAAEPFTVASEVVTPVPVDETGGGEVTEGKEIADPLQPWNRAMYTFNDRFYFWLLKPVSQGYGKVVPEWGRVRVRNFFHNITMPVRFVNCVLQLKFHSAAKEVGRFVVNSTGGIGGLFDVLKDNPNAQGSNEDLGQTFGSYGIGSGFYIVWPILGPSSLRDTVGLVGDGFLNPENYVTPYWWNAVGVQAYETVNYTSLHIGDYEDLKESALDPYISLRNAYYQHRESEIKK
jgi:phospholipid-binding lipoprotein MlaA